MVLEMDGDEDAAIAALLHDAVEDQEATFEGIEQRFGPVVREIVELATDSTEQPKVGWTTRKVAYLRRLDEKAADPARYGGYFRVTPRRQAAQRALDPRRHVERRRRPGLRPLPRRRRRPRPAAGPDTGVLLGRGPHPRPHRPAQSRLPLVPLELTRVVTEIGGTDGTLSLLT